ncbi:unnamed protein product [Ambrosiozyma monospora]|uniref:Unnamed protein product n=1 Tax=Ambrosiozyma monospora TaxID=43982 RepID=A0ACB5T4Y7_AMBMO|nr:unnamed protein product [Ambrosiozyma monospora]
MSILRSGLLRNFGGISNKQLYNKSYIGTKIIIEDYVDEVLQCLKTLDSLELRSNNLVYEDVGIGFNEDSISGSNGGPGIGSSQGPIVVKMKPPELTLTNFNQMKLDFFHDSRQTLGTTALVLQGGSLFGLVHLGVIKALYAKNLLPRVIAGSAVGALVGAFVCCLDDFELNEILQDLVSAFPPSILKDTTNVFNVIETVVKKGYSQDMQLFMEFVKLRLGELTFEDAYLKTNRILNILVCPTDNSVPSLLNYISTPNVTIMSAIYCSLGNEVFNEEAHLIVKTQDKQLVKWEVVSNRQCEFLSPHHVHNINYPKSFTPISPYTRLTELFNVNHFIVSLARPYLAPLIGNDLKHSPTSWLLTKNMKNLLTMEIRHRLDLLDKFGLLFSFLKSMAIDEKTPRFENSEITIVPELRTLLKDFSRIFDVNKYKENIPYWIQVGERSVWPLYPMLQTRCAIEFALDDYYNLHRNR